jgi:hypothetical protein
MLESTFRELCSNGAVESACIIRIEGGYTLGIKTITDYHVLSLYRGGTRIFKTVDAAVAVVQSCGFLNVLVSWEVEPTVAPGKKVPPPASKRTPPPKNKRRK